eukprot:TRINITY_DN6612_c0_g1_i2.p1 TRINITY_DN6612_c0_g1~~TRINITY_DN6612_c0_g1_i2.p1  ORF type:complete len:776 (+),score=174.38 TRINITY_DN6612_c0_g1_i2:206-2329(+)
MLVTLVGWVASASSCDAALQQTAVHHAHLGVEGHHVVLFCETLVSCVMRVLGREDRTVTHNWHKALKALAASFNETCEACSAALKQCKDASLSEVSKRTKAIKALRSHLSHERPFSGYLLMSQYSCVKWKPPVCDADHSLDCFRRRFVAIHAQYVYYYRSKDDDKPVGLIDLAQCQLVDTEPTCGHKVLPSPAKFSFALRTQAHEYPYYFIADGDNTKEAWFSKLRQACNRFSLIRSDLHCGDRLKVWVKDRGSFEIGTCRWVGVLVNEDKSGQVTPHRDGLWVGVELLNPYGNTDGAVDNYRYFTCPQKHGVLVPANEVVTANTLEIQVEGENLSASSYRPSDFDFLCVLGKGSFGRVCKVREHSMGTIYACKVLQKAALIKESQIKNVTREKSLLLNIRHPYIVKLHAAFQTHGRLFLLFDFLSGGELFYHMTMSPKGYFSEGRAQFYIAEVALAIHHLHSHSILHRDLKAENLVLDAEGHVVLTDFGFAKTMEPDVANTTKCGTLPYMSPEMLKQGPNGYSYEVDWWALGVLLFLMLTGCYPFWSKIPDETVKQILEREITPESFKVKLSKEAYSVVGGLLMKAPKGRLTASGFFNAAWFSRFDWVACRNRKLSPPFVPDSSGRNTKYFDPSDPKDIYNIASKVLPTTWNGEKALASFYDVHRDYKDKRERDTIDDRAEDELFLAQLNNWNSKITDNERYILDT